MDKTRQSAFNKSIAKLKKRGLSKKNAKGSAMSQGRYNSLGMPELNQILCGDSIQVLNQAPEGWVDLVFADPPFNIGYLYDGYDDRREVKDYLDFSRNWMKAVHRALKPNGSFFLAIGDEYAADLTCIARRELGFTMRNWIIWHYTFGQQPKNKFARSHTHILYFTKNPTEFTFNRDEIRVASARQLIYADSRANPKGKLPDDVWYLRPQETQEHFDDQSDTWYVSRICGTFKEREGWHGCQMPMGVLNRIVAAASNPGDVVLDPFNGSGTTSVAAALLGRKYVGIDQSEEYVAYARQRVEHALSKAADHSDKPLHEKVAATVLDGRRASRVPTETDSLGRKRVPRRRRDGANILTA